MGYYLPLKNIKSEILKERMIIKLIISNIERALKNKIKNKDCPKTRLIFLERKILAMR